MQTTNTTTGLESENHAWLGVLIKIRWINFSAWALWAALYSGVLPSIKYIHAQSDQSVTLRSDPYWLLTATLVVFLSLLIGNVHATKMRTNTLDLTTGNLRAQLTLDVISLTVIMMTTGGATSPLGPYFLISIGMAATMLSWREFWPFITLTPICVTIVHLTPPHFSSDDLSVLTGGVIPVDVLLHVGSAGALLLGCVSIAVFAHNYNEILTKRQTQLAAIQSRNFKTDRLRSVGTLAAGAAHELNTPLATIAMRLTRVHRRHADDKTVDDVTVAQSQLDRCDEIVSRLLIAAGNPKSEPALSRPLMEIVSNAVKLWSKGSEGSAVVIDESQNTHVALPMVASTLALSNLLNNAVQAQESIGVTTEITVTLVVEEGNAVVYVRDHGCGLPESNNQVGDPFFTTKPTGTGLGVFVARSVADGVDGGLEYIREKDGTTAKWWFPVSNPTT